MEIILGKTAGFCFGVTNAVQKTEEKLKNRQAPLYCLGELTHNAQVMEKLNKNGLVVIENLEEVEENSEVVIRAHGVKPEIYDQAKKKNICLHDFTCPRVIVIHKKAITYKEQGYYLFLIAERNHPETIGTIGFCGEKSTIIETSEMVEEAIEKWKNSSKEKIAILAQTTFSVEKFDSIVNKIKDNLPENIELKVDKTICDATQKRQKEAEEISNQVDFMIIIGGKNSANTKKLYDIALNNKKEAIWIQTKNDLDLDKLKKYNTIGIMAGASTPKEIIDEVVNKIERI